MMQWRVVRKPLLAIVMVASLGGCATTVGTTVSNTVNSTVATVTGPFRRVDPWENFNRKVFAFNDGLDKAVVKPVAQAYQAVVPGWIRGGISNMFNNLADVWSAANMLLQLKPQAALETGMRVATNTTFGLLGFLDVADEAGLERRPTEDFGQTLGRWGVKSGPYIVLPLLGPSTLRDGSALVVDFSASPTKHVFQEPRDRNSAAALQLVDTRVKLLTATNVLDDIALDKYTLLRDAYLARRRSLIYDGEPPEDDVPPPADGSKPAAADAASPAASAASAVAAGIASPAAASAPIAPAPMAPASAPAAK